MCSVLFYNTNNEGQKYKIWIDKMMDDFYSSDDEEMYHDGYMDTNFPIIEVDTTAMEDMVQDALNPVHVEEAPPYQMFKVEASPNEMREEQAPQDGMLREETRQDEIFEHQAPTNEMIEEEPQHNVFETVMFKPDKSTHEGMLPHVLWPRLLPQRQQLELDKYETGFLELMIDILDSFKVTDEAVWTKASKLLGSVHQISTSTSAEIIQNELNRIEEGGYASMFVKKQNTCLLLHMLPADEWLQGNQKQLIISTFPVSLSPEKIYSSPSSDIKVEYPAQSIRTEQSNLLKSIDFAQQLFYLTNNAITKIEESPDDDKKPEEVHDTSCVPQWLVPTLGTRNSYVVSNAEFGGISKKIRDEVLGTKSDIFEPFRRSGMWTTIKVLLQLCLSREINKRAGKFVYKLLMLKYMTVMCDFYNTNMYPKVKVDVAKQFLAKIARRIEKLNALSDQLKSDPMASDTVASYQDICENIVDNATTVVKRLREKLNKQMVEFQRQDEENSALTALKDLDFSADVDQKVPKLRAYIAEREQPTATTEQETNLLVMRWARFDFNSNEPPEINLFNKLRGNTEIGLVLNDFENWVLYKMNLSEAAIEYQSRLLRSLSRKYASKARKYYASDPLGFSRMMLTHLKIIQTMDKIAINAHALYKSHRCGINEDVLNSLLLPHKIDMQIAADLQEYFRKRNSETHKPKYFGLLEEEGVSRGSFAYRFAKRNEEMKRIRQRIKVIEKTEIEKIREDYNKAKERVEELRRRLDDMECRMILNSNRKRVHAPKCAKCKLEEEIRNVRARKYERTLPEQRHEQLAVVFELAIPDEIAHLRDELYDVVKLMQKQPLRNARIIGKWTDCEQISDLDQSSSETVFLGSSSKLQLNRNNRGNANTLHPDSSFDMLTIENGYNLTYYANKTHLPVKTENQTIEHLARFKVDIDSPYKDLDWMIMGEHSENDVLARQSECPQNLELKQFVNFGTLRADGHRTQLRKFYAMLASEGLSFETKSVQALVMQTMWQTGPGLHWHREAHEAFTNAVFTSEMCKLVNTFIDRQKANWKAPLKLVMASLVAVRMFEMNDDENTANAIAELLQKIRDIAVEWMGKVVAVMRGTQCRNDLAKLRGNLIEISIAGALTYFVHYKHDYFDKIFVGSAKTGKTSPQLWLEFLFTLNSNLLVDESQECKSNIRMFLNVIRRTGVNVEPKMRQIVNSDLEKNLYDLIADHWNTSKPHRNTFRLNNDHQSPQKFVVSVEIGGEKSNVQVDIVTGDFFVNNRPVGRLPAEITGHENFKRVFGQFIFDVQQERSKCFSTVGDYTDNGCNCSFSIDQDNKLFIVETCPNGEVFELIPHDIFADEIPYMLVENCSHWWSRTKKRVEFRPKCYTDENFSLSIGTQYKLSLRYNTLKHITSGRMMLDVTSKSYVQITKQLARLDSPKFIVIFVDRRNDDVAKVELVRMHLKFVVKAANEYATEFDMLSNEYSNMRVSLGQRCGTLYGLNHGLLLQSILPNQSKMMIVPHGSVKTKLENFKAITDIDIDDELGSPPFHTYLVDEHSKQLKAENSSISAWLYLALLHASTTYSEIEPLLGLSGAERALQILQSAYVWSSEPYNDESLQTLKNIESLAPIRQLKNNLQSVRWPSVIHSYASQDVYSIVARKLIEDSNRLKALHLSPNKLEDNGKENPISESKTKPIDELKENRRDYFRCLPLYPHLRLSEAFIDHEKHFETPMQEFRHDKFHKTTLLRKIALNCHENPSSATKFDGDFDLKCFLTTNQGRLIRLRAAEAEADDEILKKYVNKDLSNAWISLYDIARNGIYSREKLTLTLNLFARETKYSHKAIIALQTVAANPTLFDRISPPDADKFDLNSAVCDRTEIIDILKRVHRKPKNYHRMNDIEFDIYQMKLLEYMDKIGDLVRDEWPCERVNLSNIPAHEDINIVELTRLINKKVANWYAIFELGIFTENAGKLINRLNASSNENPLIEWQEPQKNNETNDVEPLTLRKFEINFDQLICRNLNNHQQDIEIAEQIYNRPENGPKPPLIRTEKEWWETLKGIMTPPSVLHLVNAELCPRFVPSVLLPKLLSPIDARLKSIIGALAVTISHEQYHRRMVDLEQLPEMQVALDRERENEPQMDWSPKDYPQWLLFELEQNLTIRSVQIKIAKRMIRLPEAETEHFVMQLNMGEGKTAVIIPLLAAVLATNEHVCQVTVLKSLFATNLKSLRQSLGGMLNQRIYTFPCRRDLPVNEHVKSMLNIYEECKREKGVILTLPEYRLSFQLKIYESICKHEFEHADSYLRVNKWLNENARNILDESDAILQPKYQLIYTVGKQLSLDGGAHRWTVIQAVLKRVKYHMRSLHGVYGDGKIELDKSQNRHDIFTPCRIIDEKVYDELKAVIIDDFTSGLLGIKFSEIVGKTKASLRILMSEKTIDTVEFDEMMKKFTGAEQNTLLILSGLLRFDILKMVLMKRYRVNYGVNSKSSRKMAVPFKAKDVAAEMTEFGHPDVAICFTHLSYYYSGLTNAQLFEVFTILDNQLDSNDIYQSWIKSVPSRLYAGHESIQSYSGINLNDPKQREQIFCIFRQNMKVIDFWLSNQVFPREAKTFEKKLMCSAWDLVSEQFKHPVSGFSGTNDTKNLLPMPVSQNDLDELRQTNDNLLQILRPMANGNEYKALDANISGLDILIQLNKHKIPVLLDAGALMLELNNENVAREWLNLAADDFNAAVFFSTNDVLMVIDRSDIITELDTSVYRDKLHQCLVYLDDVHTRGTDLKFPVGWRACVTISGEITRDKTVQACMRMRLLGKGHNIVFWSSHEANLRIETIAENRAPTNDDVIKFICENSEKFEKDNIVHWTASSYSYAKKLAAHKIHDNAMAIDATDDPLIELYQQCVDNEYVTLRQMYGDKGDVKLMDIARARFDALKTTDALKNDGPVVEFISKMSEKVYGKIQRFAADVKRFTHSLDEEQEKELEHELEEHRAVERPAPAKARKPEFNENLATLIQSGASSECWKNLCDHSHNEKKPILKLSAALHLKDLRDDPWLANFYVTRDFIRVVENQKTSGDLILRPVRWIARLKRQREEDVLLLLSTFECENLLKDFAKSKKAILYMYQPRMSLLDSNLLKNQHLTVTGMPPISTGVQQISIDEEIQIGMFAGSMYFRSEEEQKAYCAFMGLIPRPRTLQQQTIFESNPEWFDYNGFVDPNHRQLPQLRDAVGKCRFKNNPTKLAIRIIESRHQFMRKESHVAAILEKGIRPHFDEIDG